MILPFIFLFLLSKSLLLLRQTPTVGQGWHPVPIEQISGEKAAKPPTTVQDNVSTFVGIKTTGYL